MEKNEIIEKVVNFQKENFEKSFNYTLNFQEQVDQKVDAFVDGALFIPEPVKQFYKQLATTARNSRTAIKKYTDEGYQEIKEYLTTTP